MPIRLQRQSYPLQPAPDPEVDLELAGQIALSNLPPYLSDAPSVANDDADVDLWDALTQNWQDPNCSVASVIGDQTGSLVRAWVDRVLQDLSLPQPEGVFGWNFREDPDPEAFFAAAWTYFTGYSSNWQDLSSSQFDALVGVLMSRSYLLVLDGFDVMQYQEGDEYGITKDPGLRSLLHGLAAADHRCFCLIASQTHIFDLHDYVTTETYNSVAFTLHPQQLSPLIACIDDGPLVCKALGEVVLKAGYRFVAIQDSMLAVPTLLKHKPDMIFLDLVMPIANGCEMCAQIRRVACFRETPIVILTDQDVIFNRVRSRPVRASGFLAKPVEPDRVLQMIGRHLPAADAVPSPASVSSPSRSNPASLTLGEQPPAELDVDRVESLIQNQLPDLLQQLVDPPSSQEDPSPTPSVYTEVVDFLLSQPTPEQIWHFKISPHTQAQLQILLEKNQNQELTDQEQAELETYEQLDHLMILLKARARGHSVIHQKG